MQWSGQGKQLALFPRRSPPALCDVKDLIFNRTLLGNFLNFGRSWLTIGRVCSQLLQTPMIWELHPAYDRYKEEVFREYFQEALAANDY